MPKKKHNTSAYVDAQRRNYSLYVLQMRAIPAATDGLKASGRRVLWMARDGAKYKTAALAGATMPIHPHDAPEDAISTLTGPYVNNVPLFKGDGGFGTILKPKAYGASRYTSVAVSKFTKDVLLRDIEIVPMQDNYDGSLLEPLHFLPLVPMALINPTEGIAVGFRSDILPRSPDDIILAQIAYLQGKKGRSPKPRFLPINSDCVRVETDVVGSFYYFEGVYDAVDASSIRVTQLPFGLAHETFVKKLDSLMENETVIDYDDNSQKTINIVVKFKRGVLRDLEREDVLKMLGLYVRYKEILNVLHFDGKRVWTPSPIELINDFTEWRLKWYVARYERLKQIAEKDLQRVRDIITAIKKDLPGYTKKTESREELKEVIGVMGIVYIDYIADLPIYRFTQEERKRCEEKAKELLGTIDGYTKLLSDENKRKTVYIQELQEVLTKFSKGQY